MNEPVNVQWFPGHMAKAGRMIAENARLVDAVCEIIDARIPVSSRNPELPRLIGNKPILIVFNRADQADPEVTSMWRAYFKLSGTEILETDSKSGKGISRFAPAMRRILAEKLERYKVKGQATRQLRVMVAGIPNVGKSAFINKAAKRKAAGVSDRPGVTRGKQWITAGPGLELLDTPGILWPRFENPETGEILACVGAVRDEILDTETLAAHLMLRLKKLYPDCLEKRYKISLEEEAGFGLLSAAARSRGFLAQGGELDTQRMAAVFLDEFRGGILGRISLERPPGGE